MRDENIAHLISTISPFSNGMRSMSNKLTKGINRTEYGIIKPVDAYRRKTEATYPAGPKERVNIICLFSIKRLAPIPGSFQ